MRLGLFLAPILGLFLAAPANAQPASAVGASSDNGVVVTAKRPVVVTMSPGCLKARQPPDRDIPAPKVVSIYPAQGAVVRPGKLVVRISFDLPMACVAVFSEDRPLKTPFPGGRFLAKQTKDRKNFFIEVSVEANQRYGFWLNKGSAPSVFSLAGLPIAPFEMKFSTSCGPSIGTFEESLAEDGEGMHELMGTPVSTPAGPPNVSGAANLPQAGPPCAPAEPAPAETRPSAGRAP